MAQKENSHQEIYRAHADSSYAATPHRETEVKCKNELTEKLGGGWKDF